MTQKERVKYADEIERIEGLSLETIYKFKTDNLWRLTDNFAEPLVRMIFAKAETKDKQQELVDYLKLAYKNGWDFLKYPSLPPDMPNYLDDFSFEIDCGRIVTEDGYAPSPILVAPPPSPVNKTSFCVSAIHTKGNTNKDDNILPKEGSFYLQTGKHIDDPDEKERLIEHIKELEAENASLKKQLEEKRQSQPQVIEQQQASTDEWIVELLAHLCYGDEQVARDILDEIRGKEDTAIADIILERKQKNQISPKTQNRELWKILHAAKLYRGIEENFNTALRRRQQR